VVAQAAFLAPKKKSRRHGRLVPKADRGIPSKHRGLVRVGEELYEESAEPHVGRTCSAPIPFWGRKRSNEGRVRQPGKQRLQITTRALVEGSAGIVDGKGRVGLKNPVDHGPHLVADGQDQSVPAGDPSGRFARCKSRGRTLRRPRNERMNWAVARSDRNEPLADTDLVCRW
jgi:hypothetical protein